MTTADAMPVSRAHTIQQVIKWIVYTLLLINFGYYFFEDWVRASHVLTSESTLVQILNEFATSIDEAAWFILLFMFELETYVLEDKQWTRLTSLIVRGVRVLCILMIGHTVFAFNNSIDKLEPTTPIESAANLCDLADQDLSFVYNLRYTDITSSNCADLSDATTFYEVGIDPVVTTLEGLNLERDLAWADLYEVILWLLVLLAIEIVVRLQSAGITDGVAIGTANRLKFVFYGLLLMIGIYWASLSHWVYLWDEMLWIGGFAVIDMNVSEWAKELRLDQETPLEGG